MSAVKHAARQRLDAPRLSFCISQTQHYSSSQGWQPVPGHPSSALTESLMFKPELRRFFANVFFPSKEFTLRGKASFHFSFNLERWWSYCLLFGVKTWGLCDANDQRIVVSNNAEEADLVTTQAETTDESSTVYLGSCRQQNNQFNVQI